MFGLQWNCCSAQSPVQNCAVGVAVVFTPVLAGGAGRAPALGYLPHHSSNVSLPNVMLWLICFSLKSLHKFPSHENGWKTALKIISVPKQWVTLYQKAFSMLIVGTPQGSVTGELLCSLSIRVAAVASPSPHSTKASHWTHLKVPVQS